MAVAAFCLGLVAGNAAAQTLSSPAEHAILVDATTNTVLFEKDADTPFPPASMSKMMTTYLAFEMIRRGEVTLEETTIVLEQTWRDWRLQGSTMFLNAGQEVTIRDLLRGIIVQSGNDACVVLAEALAGSEDIYVGWMNEKATELGMTGSVFTNTTGWPAEGHVVTARDMAILAERIIEDFPELYKMYAETSFAFGTDPQTGKPITQGNRNPILYTVDGADGLKTGHTEESGYSLTGSAVRDGRRIIMVASGLESTRARSRESQRLIEYAFRNYKILKMFEAGQVIEEAEVWLGASGKVALTVAEDVNVTMSRNERRKMTVTLAYDGPIPAPIKKGALLATVTISVPDRADLVVPLVAATGVGEQRGFGRIGAALKHFIFGSSGK
jgi:D-alanyl-D-alanine carboxypeptidase (penicillin-binding protein 5/6)